jgi:hypothetical protein
MIRFLPLALALLPTAAAAAERTIGIGSFERLRVDGPIDVRVATGKPASATLSGDRDAIERLSVSVDGNTLTIRPGNQTWGETPRRGSAGLAVVTLTTPTLASATSLAGAKIAATRMKAPRVDLAVTGSGSIAVDAVETDQLAATAIGVGAISVASGKAARARLAVNGTATIDAAAVVAGDLQATLDGPGEVKGQARFTATVNNIGLGRVVVGGNPKCTVSARAGGPVACGVGAPR